MLHALNKSTNIDSVKTFSLKNQFLAIVSEQQEMADRADKWKKHKLAKKQPGLAVIIFLPL